MAATVDQRDEWARLAAQADREYEAEQKVKADLAVEMFNAVVYQGKTHLTTGEQRVLNAEYDRRRAAALNGYSDG